MADEKEKIELKAIFTKDGKFVITDQHGRDFDAIEEGRRNYQSSDKDRVLLRFELESPHMLWYDRPRVNLTFSIPLEAEAEMPQFIQEMIRDRLGG